MRVAVATDHLVVQIEERDDPRPGPGEITVAIQSCGACTSDTLAWYVRQKAPVVLGHEPVAIVEQMGEGVTGFAPGDRVFVHHHAPCGNCSFCRRDLPVLCPTWRTQALLPGGFAEKALVRAHAVTNDTLHIPESLSNDAALFIEPLACSLHAFAKISFRRGDRLIVIGMGVMGFINLHAGGTLGYEKIAVADLQAERLQRARDSHLCDVVDGNRPDAAGALKEATEGGGDLVIVGPGYLPAMELGMQVVAPGGTLLLFTPGPADETWPVNPNKLYFEDITLTTSYSCGPKETRRALAMLNEGEIHLDHLITHRFPLEETGKALQTLAAGGSALKVIVDVA